MVVSCSLRLKMKPMSEEKRKINKAKARTMAEYRKKQRQILKEIENKGSVTIPEISEATEIQTSDVFKHVTALTQFRKVKVVGEKEGYLAYALDKE
jgi:predicted HTH transcriptional regulator